MQGPLPSVTPRLVLTLGLESGRWKGLLSVRLGASSAISAGPTPDALVVVQPIVGAQLSWCWQERWGRLAGGPCAAVGAEGWAVHSENVAHPRRVIGAFADGGLDVRATLDLWEGLRLLAGVGGRIAFVRPSVFFEDSGVAFEASAFGAQAEVGLAWAW